MGVAILSNAKLLADDVSSALGRVPSLNANLLGNLVGLPRLRSPIAMGFRQLCVVASYRKSGDVSSAVGRVPFIKVKLLGNDVP